MDLHRFFFAVRKRWWVVVLVTMMGAIAAVGVTSGQAKQYRSSVAFFVAAPTQPGEAYQASLAAQQLVNSYVKLLGSDELARRVITHAGLHGSPHAVAGKISGTADLNTVLITAAATDSTPAGALRLSSAIAAVFGPMITSLNGDANASNPSVVLSVVSGPTNPIQVAPRRMLNYLLGIVGGLVVGLAVAALRELLDTSIRSDEQLAATGIRPLTSISRIPHAGPLPLIVGDLNRSVLAEEMRQLRTSLQYVQVDRPVQVIAVVSAEAAEGKSTVAINLALAFTEAGRRTLLIDADLRKPSIAECLGLEGAAGLADVLAQQSNLDTVLQTWGEKNLHVIATGSPPPHPAELLDGRQMADLVAQVRNDFDIVIIDTPPLRPVTDGMVVTLLSDGAIVVVHNARTRRAELERALRALRSVDAPLLGAVRNMVRLPRRGKGVHGTDVASGRPEAAAKEKGRRETRRRRDTGRAAKAAVDARRRTHSVPRPAAHGRPADRVSVPARASSEGAEAGAPAGAVQRDST